jgi:tetratricopeptide (TPR) repeat protein
MALSPLRSPSPSNARRRKSSVVPTLFGLILALGAMAWAYSAVFGFSHKLKAVAEAANQGNLQQAAQLLDSLEEKKPGDARITDMRGVIASRQGKLDEAAKLYASAEGALKESSAELHENEGAFHLKNGDYKGAELEYAHALALDKGSAKAAFGSAVCAHAQGHLSKAMDLYQQALASSPSMSEAKEGLSKARESHDRGSMYYLFDRNGQPLARIGIAQDTLGERTYPQEQYTAHVVGAQSEKFGDFGVEKELKSLFPGIEVELTLDIRCQAAAVKALGWRKGSVVVLNPNTGEILAAVSQPSFKPEDLDRHPMAIRENPNHPLLNRAFEGLYEPGSICKIITAAAALEANVDMSKLFPMTPDTSMVIDGKIFRDWENHGKIRSLKEAMDVSSNIALAKVAFAMGPDLLFEYINRFGFNQNFDMGFDLKGLGHFSVPVATPLAPLHADNQYELAERACGLGKEYRITPLHAALLAATIANHGVMMKPKLIRSARNLAGQTLYEMTPEVQREIMKPETAEKIKQIMMDAVEGDRGIGKKARTLGVTVAGKTGTARSRQNQKELDAWFICFVPADKPQYAIAVLGEREGTGMSVAAPIAGNLIRELMR